MYFIHTCNLQYQLPVRNSMWPDLEMCPIPDFTLLYGTCMKVRFLTLYMYVMYRVYQKNAAIHILSFFAANHERLS